MISIGPIDIFNIMCSFPHFSRFVFMIGTLLPCILLPLHNPNRLLYLLLLPWAPPNLTIHKQNIINKGGNCPFIDSIRKHQFYNTLPFKNRNNMPDDKYLNISFNQNVLIPPAFNNLPIHPVITPLPIRVVLLELPIVVLPIRQEKHTSPTFQISIKFTSINILVPSYLVHIYSMSSRFL